jgi:RHS repeat-associated protein
VNAAGNRTAETEFGIGGVADTQRTYVYPAQGAATPNQPHIPTAVTESGPGGNKTFEYKADVAGNTTCRPNAAAGNQCQTTEAGHQKLVWDAEGRLASSTPAGGQATTYVYDSGGNRMVRSEPGATTLYLPGLELKLDTATRQVTGTRYYTFAKKLVAVRSAGAVSFPILDTNGTACAMIDAVSGAIKWQRTTPYGEGRGTAPGSWPNQQGFVGGVEDPNGLTHLGARDYDPVMGRFVSDDPVSNAGDPQSMNGFSYADSNPSTFKDPEGTCIIDDDGNCWRPPTKTEKAQEENCGMKSASQCGPDKIVAAPSPILYTTISGHGPVLVIFNDGAAMINGYLLPPGMPGTPDELASAIDKLSGGVTAENADELRAKTAHWVAALCWSSYCTQNDANRAWGQAVNADAAYLDTLVPVKPHEPNWWDHWGGLIVALAGIGAFVTCVAATAGWCLVAAGASALLTAGDATYRYNLIPNPTPQDRFCLGLSYAFAAVSTGRAVTTFAKGTHAAMTAEQEMAKVAWEKGGDFAEVTGHLGLHACEYSVSYH